ncbi:hypothetical protein HA466_0314500 [Hirschfeldia incana]|nr:hypothetical protein HA466_0314500 [Hirschfeldia incana]
MSDDAAIRGFMEKVDAFFISGGNRDEVPQSDGNIIRLCKREHLRSTGSEDKKKASLRYAYALALSPKYEDVEVGINLLEGEYLSFECLFFKFHKWVVRKLRFPISS